MKTNYWAVLVCAVVYWLLGAVWFGVVFGNQWMALEGMTAEQAKNANVIWPYIISFLLNLVIALMLAQLCIWRNADTAMRGAAIGILVWLGFVGPITYMTNMYEMRSRNLFVINEGYPLVGLFVMGLVLGAWKKKAA